jgi:hypothetical protein
MTSIHTWQMSQINICIKRRRTVAILVYEESRQLWEMAVVAACNAIRRHYWQNSMKYVDRQLYWTDRQQRNAATGWLVYAGKAELFQQNLQWGLKKFLYFVKHFAFQSNNIFREWIIGKYVLHLQMVRQHWSPAPQGEFKRTLEKLWLSYKKDFGLCVCGRGWS